MGHKFIDKRGTNQPSYKAGFLYPNPNYGFGANPTRPHWYYANDTSQGIDCYNRVTLVSRSREMFAGMGNIGGAIIQKNDYAFTDGWLPQFKGENQEWGDAAENWLKDTWYKGCNTRGGNYSFNVTLAKLGQLIDVDGEALIVLTNSRDGFPLIQVIQSNRIGQRDNREKVVATGRYRNLTICDGVILNSVGKPAAYRILGDTADEDYEISAQSAMLIMEPEWADQYRGIPRLARIILDLQDTQDIDHFLKRIVKLESRQGIFRHSATGQPDSGARLTGLIEDEPTNNGVPAPQTATVFEEIGDILYAKAADNEKLESFNTDRPHANTEAFIGRIERRCLYAIGWPIELLDPSKIGGASVRLIQDLARKSIKSRQNTVERAARLMVAFAISSAMQTGLIPENYDDTWYKFAFTRPATIVVDNGNESKADNEGLKLGTTTLSAVTAKQGNDWQELRKQTQKETEDLLDRATALAAKYKITLDKALALLSQRTPNDASQAQAPIDTGIQG